MLLNLKTNWKNDSRDITYELQDRKYFKIWVFLKITILNKNENSQSLSQFIDFVHNISDISSLFNCFALFCKEQPNSSSGWRTNLFFFLDYVQSYFLLKVAMSNPLLQMANFDSFFKSMTEVNVL